MYVRERDTMFVGVCTYVCACVCVIQRERYIVRKRKIMRVCDTQRQSEMT